MTVTLIQCSWWTPDFVFTDWVWAPRQDYMCFSPIKCFNIRQNVKWFVHPLITVSSCGATIKNTINVFIFLWLPDFSLAGDCKIGVVSCWSCHHVRWLSRHFARILPVTLTLKFDITRQSRQSRGQDSCNIILGLIFHCWQHRMNRTCFVPSTSSPQISQTL